jgi:5-methylcytosine-specific restriction enzyme subunit McrC
MGVIPSDVNNAQEAERALVGAIPVRNLWLLLLYASDLFRSGITGPIGLEKNQDDIPNLIAELLAHTVERRQRRNLTLGYRERQAAMPRIRGRVDALKTVSHRLMDRGLVACRFDELTIDTPRNRFVCAALERMAQLTICRNAETSKRCRTLAASWRNAGVANTMPGRADMAQQQFGRCDVNDRLMVGAARLAFDLCLPNEEFGAHWSVRPERDSVAARKLFERAVGGFYEVALARRGWRVRPGKTLHWPAQEFTQGAQVLLPNMIADIVLDHAESARRILVDTKFTAATAPGRHGKVRFKSAHIYQLFAYLRSQANDDSTISRGASGLLLYPSIGQTIDEAVTIDGHRLRFATVDLAGSTTSIRRRLLSFCDEDDD